MIFATNGKIEKHILNKCMNKCSYPSCLWHGSKGLKQFICWFCHWNLFFFVVFFVLFFSSCRYQKKSKGKKGEKKRKENSRQDEGGECFHICVNYMWVSSSGGSHSLYVLSLPVFMSHFMSWESDWRLNVCLETLSCETLDHFNSWGQKTELKYLNFQLQICLSTWGQQNSSLSSVFGLLHPLIKTPVSLAA